MSQIARLAWPDQSMTAFRTYLSLLPEALLASMLTPEQFGHYYAVGVRSHVRGEAVFFDVDPDFRDARFDWEQARSRCVAKTDGSPKRSVYLGIHEVLARVPIPALGRLYLGTADGLTLGLERQPWRGAARPGLFLYQELCPVSPLVASRLDPAAFGAMMTQPGAALSVPRLAFAALRLGELALDPRGGSAADLPYPDIEHLRDVLEEVAEHPHKQSKLVFRQGRGSLPYRMIEFGFFVAEPGQLAFYPMPDRDALDGPLRAWWRSAQVGVLE